MFALTEEQEWAVMALLTIAMLLVYFWTGLLVGRARTRLDVPGPRTEGPDEFNRIYRAHVNTLEQLVLALPAFWVFNLFDQSTWWTILFVIVWCVGRVIFVLAYARDAAKRSTGFMISLLPTAAAVVASIVLAIRILIEP